MRSFVLAGAKMTTLRSIELCCPLCRFAFASNIVVSTNTFGGKRTDFHARATGTQPLPYQVHMCGRCGYSGAERDFTEQAEISPFVREHVWAELAPTVSVHVLGSEKYDAAAKVAEWQGAELRQIGELWLRAAWCCVDERDVEAERFYRLRAVRAFEAALGLYDGIEYADRAVLTYLVGELWRRIGDTRVANGWFDRVAEEITDWYAQQWIVDAARRQQTDPREWFG
jgi:uncharacterized protein (DUF2225 family)